MQQKLAVKEIKIDIYIQLCCSRKKINTHTVCYSATMGVVPFHLCPTSSIVIPSKRPGSALFFRRLALELSLTFALLRVSKGIVRVKFNELFCTLSK